MAVVKKDKTVHEIAKVSVGRRSNRKRIELQKTLRECEKCIDVYCDKDKEFINHWIDTFESDLQ